jgi:Asp-tRNA(Asn)/Glu-tRNA(Gln) amidotransferase A subunit family amidase
VRGGICNLCPGSAAGIPGLPLPAGQTKAGLPFGIALDGPEHSDHQLLAIGRALETLLPEPPLPQVWRLRGRADMDERLPGRRRKA